jgi:hypothetical protein
MAPWTAPPVERTDPDLRCGERAMLEQWVDFHRQTLLGKCAGLTGEELAQRSVPPSTMSLLGLVRHMTDVERWWFLLHVDGRDPEFLYWVRDGGDPDFDDVDPAHAERDIARYLDTIEQCRAAAADRSLDEVVPRYRAPEVVYSVRWIWTHMVEEYARHNGHADLLRQAIDGAVGD